MQIVHQLAADTEACMLAPDLGSCLLLASARDPGRPTRCLAMHSLSPETGLFAPQGRVPLPPIGSTFPSTAGSNQFKPQVWLPTVHTTTMHPLCHKSPNGSASSLSSSLVSLPASFCFDFEAVLASKERSGGLQWTNVCAMLTG